MLKKISTQKKSDSRAVETQKLTEVNNRLKSQNFKLQEKNLKLKKTIFDLKYKISSLKTQISKKGRKLEDLIEEHFNEVNKQN